MASLIPENESDENTERLVLSILSTFNAVNIVNDDNNEDDDGINNRIAFSDHIVYCFDRKFSNYYIPCNSFEQELVNKYPFDIDENVFDLQQYRFLRKKNKMFYYLQIEPDDICPFGTECKWIECNRIHYISNEDICRINAEDSNKKCLDTTCHKIHILWTTTQRMVDRICSLLYDSYQRRDILLHELKFDEYSVDLCDFMKLYKLKYGEFIGYDCNHSSDGMMMELKRVLTE